MRVPSLLSIYNEKNDSGTRVTIIKMEEIYMSVNRDLSLLF